MKRVGIIFALALIAGTTTACGGSSLTASTAAQTTTAETEVETEIEAEIETVAETTAKPETTAGKDEETLKNEQLAIITSVSIVEQSTEYKSLYPDMVQWILENKSGNVIKNYTVSVLAYDENGYPVKVEGQYDYKPGFEKSVLAEAVNVQPDTTHGDDYGYGLGTNHGIAYAIVLVKELEFYDSDTWKNPYYDIWIKKYKEKPISLDDLNAMYN